jgi:[protein-PII] uridylyltransferase
MPSFDDPPITDEREIRDFLQQTPIAVDEAAFTRFVLGFPHSYLARTSPVEVLKHFALLDGLGNRASTSALSREGSAWKLVVVAQDRQFLFSQIAGSLAVFGANILEAEAIANTSGIVLDIFRIAARGEPWQESRERRRFQSFLEGVLLGQTSLEEAVTLDTTPTSSLRLELDWDDAALRTGTLLRIQGRDSIGLLYRITRCLSEAGCNIEFAHVETPEGTVRDEFVLTSGGKKLEPAAKEQVARRLGAAIPPASSPEPAKARRVSVREDA